MKRKYMLFQLLSIIKIVESAYLCVIFHGVGMTLCVRLRVNFLIGGLTIELTYLLSLVIRKL